MEADRPEYVPEDLECPRCGGPMEYGRVQRLGEHCRCEDCDFSFLLRKAQKKDKFPLPKFPDTKGSVPACVEERIAIIRQFHEVLVEYGDGQIWHRDGQPGVLKGLGSPGKRNCGVTGERFSKVHF